MNIRNRALRAPILAASLALLISQGTPSIALAEAAIPRQPVRYGDLDLATVDGRATLESRIHRAADRVCEVGDQRNLVAARDARTCRDAAITRGMIEADALLALATRAVATGPAVTCAVTPDNMAVVAKGP